jgi:peptidoglycan hydrolase CwlO-like protein
MKKIILTVAIAASLFTLSACDKVAQCDEKREKLIDTRDHKINRLNWEYNNEDTHHAGDAQQLLTDVNKCITDANDQWEAYKSENKKCQGSLD